MHSVLNQRKSTQFRTQIWFWKLANVFFRPGKKKVFGTVKKHVSKWQILKHCAFRDGRNDVVVVLGKKGAEKKAHQRDLSHQSIWKAEMAKNQTQFLAPSWCGLAEPDQDAGSANASVSKSRNEAAMRWRKNSARLISWQVSWLCSIRFLYIRKRRRRDSKYTL